MSAIESRDDPLYATIESEAVDELEAADSQALYRLLKARRQELGASSEIPADDQQLSEAIHTQAATRSQEISVLRQVADRAHHERQGDKPIPWWLWLLWLVALAAAAAFFLYP
jgi:hypothetical protein